MDGFFINNGIHKLEVEFEFEKKYVVLDIWYKLHKTVVLISFLVTTLGWYLLFWIKLTPTVGLIPGPR